MARLSGKNKVKAKALNAAALTTTATNGAAAAGANPTKAEYDVLVTLVNELKADHNNLVTALKA
jgi:hypothetical protein